MEQNFDFLNIKTNMVNGKITYELGGLLGGLPQVKSQVERFFKVMNSLKVIGRTEDGLNVYNLYNPPQPSPAGMTYLVRSVRQLVMNNSLPATANIHITPACQCKCVHCSADPFIDPTRKMLTTEELKECVRAAQRLGTSLVIFTGGDPFCHKDFFELVRTVDKTKSMPMIFTNGLGLTEENCRKAKDAGLYSLNVSIDSPEPADHDTWRKVPGLWKKALEGAARARKVGIFTGISTYITREGLDAGKLERMLDLTAEQGFHELTIFDCMPSGNFLHDDKVILNPQERARVVEICEKYNSDPNYKPGVVAQSKINSPAGVGCFGARAQFYLTCYGDMNPCDFNPISFGNVHDMPLEALWFKMTAHADFRIHHLTCRMQTPEYRKRFIDVLGPHPKLPVPIEEIERIWQERGIEMLDYSKSPNVKQNPKSVHSAPDVR